MLLLRQLQLLSLVPPCPANNKILKKIRSERECLLDTPFGTQLIRYLNPVPNYSGPKKNTVRTEVFVGQGIHWTRGR